MSASPMPMPLSQTASISLTRWRVLLGAIVIQLILGTIYGYSVFWQPLERAVFPPIVTAARAAELGGAEVTGVAEVAANDAQVEKLHATRQGFLKYAFGICLFSFAATMVFAGRLQDMRGPSFTAALGGGLLAIGFLIAGLSHFMATFYICHGLLMGAVTLLLLGVYHALLGHVNADHYPIVRYIPQAIVTAAIVAGIALGNYYVADGVNDRVFLLWATIGLVAGAGIGFAYVCPIAALVKWFPTHKGVVSGVAVAGFGLGAWIFSQKWVFGAVGFIEKYGIDNFFLAHAVVCLLAVCGGAMLLVNPPAGFAVATPAGKPAEVRTDRTWRETLRTPVFYVVWLMFFSGTLAGLMVIGILKPFAGQQLIAAAGPIDDRTRSSLLLSGAAAVGWLAIFNAIGRVFWGFLSDRIGRTTAMSLMFALQAVMMLLLIKLNTYVLLAVGSAWVGFHFGGCFAVFPSLTADLFGSRNLGANYGWVFTAYGVAGISGVALGNYSVDLGGSYFAAFAIAAGLCALSAILAWLLAARRKPAVSA